MSEKLALQRELAALKPEVEHLRSQLAQQKDVLAEKLALERQLSAMEMELAKQKRAAERSANKGSETEEELQALRQQLAAAEHKLKKHKDAAVKAHEEAESLRQELEEAKRALKSARKSSASSPNTEASSEEIAQLRQELAETRKALEEERKEHEKQRKQHEQALVDAEERQQAMGDRIEKLRGKLREARDELKKARAELERQEQERTIRASSVASSVGSTAMPAVKGISAVGKTPLVSRKKAMSEEPLITEKVLQTPSCHDDKFKRPLIKKRGFDLSMVGGKSEFSITPFLNKTGNVDDLPAITLETPAPAAHIKTEHHSSEEDEKKIDVSLPSKLTLDKKSRGRPAGSSSRTAKPLADAPPSASNLPAIPRPRIPKSLAGAGTGGKKGASSSTSSSLEKVSEEPEDLLADEDTTNATNSTATTTTTDEAKHDQENRANTTVITTKSGATIVIEKKKKKRLLGAGGKGMQATSAAAVFGATDGEVVIGGDAEEIVRPVVRKVSGKVNRAGGNANGGQPSKSVFGSGQFSPLKRDRRGVGASFLV